MIKSTYEKREGKSYRLIWIELAKGGVKKIDHQETTGIYYNLLADMGKNEYILMKNFELIYRKMNPTPKEVIEFKDENLNE